MGVDYSDGRTGLMSNIWRLPTSGSAALTRDSSRGRVRWLRRSMGLGSSSSKMEVIFSSAVHAVALTQRTWWRDYTRHAQVSVVRVQCQNLTLQPASALFPHSPTWKCTNLAMLGSAMNIWCSRQQMRHCTSLRSLSRPPSISASSTFLPPLRSGLPSSDLTGLGALMLVSRLSLLAPSCCSSEVGRHTSNKIWTAALSWR